MSEAEKVVRVRNSDGNWMVVKFLSFGEVRKSGKKFPGIVVQKDDGFPFPVEAEDVHPDDYGRLIAQFGK